MRFSRFIALLLAGSLTLITLITAVGGATSALWKDEANAPEASVGIGQVWVALQPEGGSAVTATPSAPASLPFKAEDAVAALEPNGVAKQFQVILQSNGHWGMEYSFQLPQLLPDAAQTVAVESTFYFYRLDSNSSCSWTNLPGDAESGKPGDTIGPFQGLAPAVGQRTSAEQAVTENWCVVMRWDRENADRYENTATVTGEATTTNSKTVVTVTDEDSWKAVLIPKDPELNPDYPVVLQTQFSRPAIN
jgi:hypothetical protein